MVPFTMGSAVHAEPLEDALLHVAENVRQSEERLLELASIPSISAQVSEHRSDFDKAAKWLQKRMAAIGLKVCTALAEEALPD